MAWLRDVQDLHTLSHSASACSVFARPCASFERKLGSTQPDGKPGSTTRFEPRSARLLREQRDDRALFAILGVLSACSACIATRVPAQECSDFYTHLALDCEPVSLTQNSKHKDRRINVSGESPSSIFMLLGKLYILKVLRLDLFRFH
jgi:hypothetical protein